MKSWKTYLVKCADGTFYCGVTNKPINERVHVHNEGKGAKYTRGRLPVVLLSLRENLTHSQALKLEYLVKQQSKDNKVTTLQTAEV